MMTAAHKTILVVTGPTASGKSAFALRLAQELGGVVINADSMQVYKQAPILTARPTVDEQKIVPHYAYGIRDAADPCSVREWMDIASQHCMDAIEKNMQPILVGGTGMYLRGIMQGVAHVPDIAPEIRSKVRLMPSDTLYVKVCEHDPHAAKRLKPQDTQRLARVLEVVLSTGKTLGDWQRLPTASPLPNTSWLCISCERERADLYHRINIRYDGMIASGGVQEAQELFDSNLPRDLPLMRSVGIAQLLQYYDGAMSLPEAIEFAKTRSRNYAKRQITWIRNQFPRATAVQMSAPIDSSIQRIMQQLDEGFSS